MLQTMSTAALWAAQQLDNGEVYSIPDGAKSKSNTVSRPLSQLTLILLVLPQLLKSHL